MAIINHCPRLNHDGELMGLGNGHVVDTGFIDAGAVVMKAS